MSTFDVVSEIDRQEVKNAIDQAQREIGTRFDFKNTDSSIEHNDLVLTLRTVSEDRLAALRLVVEEKLVKRGVSLKGTDYGKVEEATQNTVRQVVTLKVDPGRDRAGHRQEARRPAGSDRVAEGCRPGHPPAVPELPRLTERTRCGRAHAAGAQPSRLGSGAGCAAGAGHTPPLSMTPRSSADDTLSSPKTAQAACTRDRLG